MKFTVTIHQNRITVPLIEDCKKVQLYFSKYKVDIFFTFKKVDVQGYKSVFDSAKNRWLLQGAEKLIKIDENADANIFAFNQLEWLQGNKLRFDTPTSHCYPLFIKPFLSIPFINLATHPIEHSIGLTWKSLAHELMHSMVQDASLKGMYVPDVMDTYIHNDDPDHSDGNFARQWKLLESYINSQTIDTVPLKRNWDNGTQTLGDLVTGTFACKTLERPWKNNAKNISCIPTGTYQCKYTYSLKFLKWTYEVLNVPNRSGIRIHSGNYFYDIEGCILLGTGYGDLNKDKFADIVESKITIKKFEDYMGRKPFTLQIV